MVNDQLEDQNLFSWVKQLIEQSKRQVAISVNSTMSMLYWKIGRKINDEILQNKRAEYGKTIIVTLSRQLEIEYGNSFSEKSLSRMKMGDFEAGFKGQMELYLRFLVKYEKAEGENAPIGLILCSGKNKEHVELMQLDQANIRVADYLTALPSQELLQEKLHKAVEIARQKLTST